MRITIISIRVVIVIVIIIPMGMRDPTLEIETPLESSSLKSDYYITILLFYYFIYITIFYITILLYYYPESWYGDRP